MLSELLITFEDRIYQEDLKLAKHESSRIFRDDFKTKPPCLFCESRQTQTNRRFLCIKHFYKIMT
jgi:hypothetical protein